MNEAGYRKRNTVFTLICMILLGAALTRGEYWDFQDEIFKETGFIAADLILVVLIPLIVYKNHAVNAWVGRQIESLKRLPQYWKTILKAFVLYALSVPISLCGGLIFSKISGYELNFILNASAIAIGLSLITCILFRNCAYEKADKLYLCLALIIGAYMVIAQPAEVGMSWDDQIHYDRAIAIGTLNGPYYKSDSMMMDLTIEPGFKASEEGRWERTAQMDNSFEAGEREDYNHGDMKHISSVGYVFYDIGMIAARGLSLSYTVSFRIGKMVNLLGYALLIAAGIRRLKYGRILAAVTGLIPTSLFLATSFSYDTWLTAFMILGFCYFFGALQRRDEKLTDTELVIMLGSFLIGCLVKAIYCGAMLPLLFMPRDKFESKKQYRNYLISGFAIVFFLISIFMGPRLIHGAGTGDARGGTDVNATEQVHFILSQPKEYLNILINFLKTEYLTSWSAGAYSVNYAYLGADTRLWYVVPPVILFTALTDKDGKWGRTFSVTIFTMLAMLIMIVLIATSMYISFTPVQNPTINGAQPRYLIPLIFPALYVNSIDWVNLKKGKNIYAALLLLTMALINVISIGSILYWRF